MVLMPCIEVNKKQREQLRETARRSVEHAVRFNSRLSVDPALAEGILLEPRATFVTLKLNGKLRGCIGCLEAQEPLLKSVANNAYAAALTDRRFNPVDIQELPYLEYEISVLTPAEPLDIENEQDLLKKIRPGIDGLILEDGLHRATYLPSVWQQLPEPINFVRQLKLKAGLAEDYWSDTIRFSSYRTESF
jgi:hypothetical protein